MKDKSVLNSFNALRKSSQKCQIKSGIEILRHFFSKQKEFNEEEPCNELKLGIERVIRGLGAPRCDSRRGFFMTFVGMCNVFSSSTFTLEMCFAAIEKELSDFTTKTDENEVWKGQILAYGGLIYSNKILEANHKEIQKVIRQLILISSKKSYLSLAVHTFLVEYIKKIDERTFKKSIWPLLRQHILQGKDNKSLQWYHLLSIINDTFSKFVDEKFLIDLTQYPNVYDIGNLDSLGSLLLVIPRNSVCIDSPVYQDILQNIVIKKKKLKTFWLLVDNKLSSATSAVICHVFRLFICCCEKLNDKNLINYMLTPNFVAILEFKSDAPNVEEVRQQALEQLLKTISKNDAIECDNHLKIIQKLFFNPGSINFLRGYGFKIFQAFVNNFSKNTVQSVVKCFTDILCSTNTIDGRKENIQTAWRHKERKTACHVVVKLINHPAVIDCVDWKVEQMKIFINIAFFTNNLTTELVEAGKQCFFSGLDIKFHKLSDLRTYLNEIVIFLNEKMCDSSCDIGLNKEAKKCWKKMIIVIKEFSTEMCNTDNEKLINTMFHILFLVLGIMTLKDPDSAVDSFNELFNVYKHKSYGLNDSKDKEDDKEEPYWTDVLVELLLSLLSNNSHFVRNIVTSVFTFLCPHLSTQNIDQILNVLNPNVDNVMSDTGLAEGDEENDDKDSSSSMEEDDEVGNGDLDKLRDALGDNGGVTDNESVDLDDMDEEQGKQLDKSLSEAFKQIKQQKLKAKSEEQKALSHFRARVIDLLETWLKTQPPLNTIFEVMVTIIMLLEKSLQTGTDLELQTRLKALLMKLSSVKRFSTDEKVRGREMGELIKKLMDKTEKSTTVYVNMSQQIVNCCTFILKVSMRDLKGVKNLRSIILEAYKEALSEFFIKTNPIVPVGLFQLALNLPWEGSFEIAKDISEYIVKPDARPFHIKHGLNLLQTFLRNKRILTEDICTKYCEDLQHLASKLLNNTTKFQGTYQNQYVAICQSIVNIKTVRDNVEQSDIDKLKSLSSKKRQRDDQAASPGKNKKQKQSTSECDMEVDENEEEVVKEHESKVRSKKKYTKREKDQHKTALKVKKKRKHDRSEGMSQGIEEGVFGSFLFDNSSYMNGNVF